jgi:hypothetical protein
MNQNKLTFESEGLTVDYVTFNFEQLNESRKAHLINYFYKLGFNSYDTDRKYRNAFDESIKYNSKNLYQIRFIKNITPHLIHKDHHDKGFLDYKFDHRLVY